MIFLRLCVAGLITFGAVAASAQSGFYILPHIQNISTEQATLIWETNEIESSQIELALEGKAPTFTVSDNGPTKVHRIVLNGLQAGTRYTYKVTSGSDIQEATFITAPATDSEMTFVVTGDSRRWDNRWTETGMDKHVLQWDADLYLTMGDLVMDGHQYEQWPEHFQRFEELTRSKWFVTARGNHEGSQIRATENDWFAKYHELPGDGEPYAYFDWGNTHFVLISYESTGRQKDWSKSAEWLDKHLEGVDKQHIVVAHHFPVYCTGYYGTGLERKEPGENAEDFRDVMDKHNVTLNASGHTHIYERHYPLKNNERNDHDGTWYVVNGGDINANFPDWWTAVSDNRAENAKPTYTVYQAKQDRMIARTFAWNKSRNEIEEIDYFVIWEDESVPSTRLSELAGSKGDALIACIDDVSAMMYGPAAKAILPYLNDANHSVRIAAAKALATLSNADVAEDLLPYLLGDDPLIAKYCARAIEGAMPKSIEKQVTRLLTDDATPAEVRFHLVGALEFHGDNVDAGKSFLEVLEDASVDGELRNRLGYSLIQVADKKLVRGLIRQFKVEDSQYVTISLAQALNIATGQRRMISDRSPIANSRPGMREEYVKEWKN